MDPRLARFWSKRRQVITARQEQLAAEFATTHGRTPDFAEQTRLFAQATTDTRQRKHAPRSEHEQRAAWWSDAASVLGGDQAIVAMLRRSDGATGCPRCRTRSTRRGWRVPRPTSCGRWRSARAPGAAARSGRRSSVVPATATCRSRISTSWSRRPWPARCRRSCRCGSGETTGSPSRRPCAGRTGRACSRSPARSCTRRPTSWRPRPASSLPRRAPAAQPSPARSSNWRCSRRKPTARRSTTGRRRSSGRSRRPAFACSSRWRLLEQERRRHSVCSPTRGRTAAARSSGSHRPDARPTSCAARSAPGRTPSPSCWSRSTPTTGRRGSRQSTTGRC